MASRNQPAVADYRRMLEVCRDAYNTRDADAFVSVWHTDCEWHPFLTARVEADPGYHGHNGIRAWFEDTDEMFTDPHVELEQFRQIGERLLVLGGMTATGRGSGVEVSSEVAWVVQPRAERLWRGWAYDSHEQGEREAAAAS